jgi:endoglucanase
VYGPDVYNQYYFQSGDFPANMPSIWYNQWGFAERVHGQRAVVLGEWGGFMGRGPSGWRDRVWHDAMVEFLLANCLEDSFYWTINPNVRKYVHAPRQSTNH